MATTFTEHCKRVRNVKRWHVDTNPTVLPNTVTGPLLTRRDVPVSTPGNVSLNKKLIIYTHTVLELVLK